ncbi:HPr kinase/phosphorylase, partial [bacterium]|nr:HPr kinase/phosphorylase [bacterium]
PMIIIPVRPGRNIATIIEVATKNHRLRRTGIFTAKQLDEELISMSKKQIVN